MRIRSALVLVAALSSTWSIGCGGGDGLDSQEGASAQTDDALKGTKHPRGDAGTSTADAGSTTADAGTSTTDAGSAVDSGTSSTTREEVSNLTASSPTEVTLWFSGSYETGDALWVQAPGMGYGWGCGWWRSLTSATFEGATPGGTYSAWIRHADGTETTHVSVTLPALTPETNKPLAYGLQQGGVYINGSAALGIYAKDDSGIARVDFFANGQAIGTYTTLFGQTFATDASGVPLRYVATPASLVGTTANLRADVYDVLGNMTSVSGTLSIQ